MLDDLTCDDQVEVPVRVGKRVLLDIEVIYFASELSVWKPNRLLVDFARLPVIGSPHFAVAAYPLKQGSNLHIAAELQGSSRRLRWRHKRHRPRKPWHMRIEIRTGACIRRRHFVKRGLGNL